MIAILGLVKILGNSRPQRLLIKLQTLLGNTPKKT
jgi:hypothetical protein